MSNIYYGKQFIDLNDINLVKKSLRQELITTGQFVKKFEKKILQFLKVKFAITCNSATAGLHLAFLSINLKKDDIILMPAINFVAAYNMCKLFGAKIFLVDVDPLSGQMTPGNLLNCIINNKIKNIKAIITMYLGGYPENILEFEKIKKKYKCFLIEDACHAFGAQYKSKKNIYHVGSCKHSDISVFSFHPVKTITSGEGGCVTTNNKFLAKKIFLLRSHGIERNNKYSWEYNIKHPGFNYRLSDINCALGLSQLSKVKKFIAYRKNISSYYKKELSNFVQFFSYNKNNNPSYHLFLISINFKKKNLTKNKFMLHLKKHKINCQYHYIPIYKFKFFKDKKYNRKKYFRNSEYYYKNTISLPIYYNLFLKDQKKIVNVIKNLLK
jgi:dTDP-4-amino-4,6-dideoxygalactose transaminase